MWQNNQNLVLFPKLTALQLEDKSKFENMGKIPKITDFTRGVLMLDQRNLHQILLLYFQGQEHCGPPVSQLTQTPTIRALLIPGCRNEYYQKQFCKLTHLPT